MSITQESAVVWRGGGRRWFTKRAAANAVARAAIKRRCDCDPGDSVTPGEPCRYHYDPERYKRILRTLAYFAISRTTVTT